ncbi:hypothetical protein HPB51_027283 [Rhipicephalus microplus]|uniref:GH18 domain-containing protein n=1 Tax=Rhipicephalus microplus TaxID=6941 RepID=A0A9J6D0L3_RHIMP|nr:hypothetical protein HPB51_027283 [Rhipicephalus microplus]
MKAPSLESSSAWQSESSSDCGCRFELSEEQPQEPRVDESDGGESVIHGQQLFGRPAPSSRGGESDVEAGDVSEAATPRQDRTRAQRLVSVYVAPLWGRRMAALRRKCSPLWLYTGATCAAIVVATSFLLAPSAADHAASSPSSGPLLRLDRGVRSRLEDDEHAAQWRGAHVGGTAASVDSEMLEPPLVGGTDPYCQAELVQEREDSWNASELEFLAPRLVRNGSRAVLCFYDRRAHRLPPPYAYFPRQMALRYCTHAVYHAPFALHDGRLAYRNPGFDRQFGMPELARVARIRGYGTQLLFTVGGEDTDNANWSRLASDEVRRETFAKDLKETLVTLGYDGVNLHWSTPGGRCGRAGDAHALTDLVRLLRTRLRRPLAPRDFLLVVTLPPQEHFVEVASQLAPLAKLTDFLVVQAHSMYGPSSPWPRCASPYEAVQGPSVRALLDSLAARLFHGHWGKLCITHSLAAVTYRLADYGTGAVGAIVGDISEGDGASAGPGEPQPITGTPGKAAYFEVCGWTRQRSRSRECSMLRSGSTVAALEGPEALRHKLARMALDGHGRLCLAALDTHLDDPLGACGGAMSPLLKRLYEDPLET